MRDIKKDIAIISAHIIRFHIVNIRYEQVEGCSGWYILSTIGYL